MPTSLPAPLPAIPERSYEASPTEELPSKILDIAPAAPVVVAEEKPEVRQEQEVLVINKMCQQFLMLDIDTVL